jgi:16S rRNA (guanine527-N7)-methyltransferase
MTRLPATDFEIIRSPKWADYVVKGAKCLGVAVSPSASRLLAEHACELLLWNSRFNLTAITEPFAMAEKHYIDSLAALAHIPRGVSVLDIGTGGGFPGIPVKTVRPGTSVTLVEAKARKVSFLKHTIRKMRLEGIEVICGRAETLHELKSRFDVVISRALMAPAEFVDLAQDLSRPGGAVLVMQGRTGGDPLAAVRGETKTYRLPYSQARRSIVVVTT